MTQKLTHTRPGNSRANLQQPKWHIKLVVLDFDGTLTRVNDEAVPYARHYKISVARALGMDMTSLSSLWNQTRRQLMLDPTKGWEENGVVDGNPRKMVVAPMTADPLVESRAIARHILESRRYVNPEGKNVSDFQDELFKRHYHRCLKLFKPDAKSFVERLMSLFEHVLIVTNSGTNAVREKLSMLGLAALPEGIVRGDAKKYKPHWQDELSKLNGNIPPFISIDGFDREVLLRRGFYGKVLLGLLQEFDIAPENVLVVGDIPELDLCLPAQLGMHTMLVAGKNTQDFERRLVLAQNGEIVNTLTEGLDLITKLTGNV